ncbi:MAG: ATP-binding cassette domain-containing protein [Fibrobacteres bacterium]|nr:ATP-binding cassette domain-containing protein [Fibrobacterota bacterium]
MNERGMSVIASVHNLRFGYAGQEPILRRVNFHVLPGQILVICGLSGQGKSTLLRLLIGLEKPDAGVIRLLGRDISGLNAAAFNDLKKEVGFVFQNPALISNKTIFENVALPLIYHNIGDEDEIRYRVDNALEMLLIKDHQHQYPANVSLGILKRAAVARAMIMRPKLILMDEPTAGLDRISRSVLLALIANIRRINHVSMVLVTHDLLAARELGGEIGVLKEGELLQPMNFEQLKNCQDSFVEFLFRQLEQEAAMTGEAPA